MKKELYVAGELVTLRQDVSNKPQMIVKKVEKMIFKGELEDRVILLGIRCQWFSSDQRLQEAIFDTKDLMKL